MRAIVYACVDALKRVNIADGEVSVRQCAWSIFIRLLF